METPTRAVINTVIRIPIGDLIVDANIRRDTKMKAGFAASVKQHGVIEPVDAYQDDAGAWHLQDGQLRYLASLDSGLTDIPVLVNDPALAEPAKLIKQLIKNQQRADLSEADEANAWQSLFDLGVSADSIAKKTNKPRKTIEQGLAVNQSTFGTEALDAGIGLDKVAAILEYEDHPEIVEKLTQVAVENPGRFAHALETAKVDLEDLLAKQNLIETVNATGVMVHEPGPIFSTAVPLEQVFKDSKLTQPLTTLDSPTANGILAQVKKTESYVNGQGWIYTWAPIYYVDDPESHGLFVKKASPTGKAPMTEEQSAERKRVIANNKAWPIATTVRHQWITDELLNRKTLPSDTHAFVGIGIAGGHPRHSYSNGLSKAAEWLDIKAKNYRASEGLIDELEKKPGASDRIALAMTLANAEEELSDKEAWRKTDDRRDKAARYLIALAAWGYNLAPVEAELIAAAKKAGSK